MSRFAFELRSRTRDAPLCSSSAVRSSIGQLRCRCLVLEASHRLHDRCGVRSQTLDRFEGLGLDSRQLPGFRHQADQRLDVALDRRPPESVRLPGVVTTRVVLEEAGQHGLRALHRRRPHRSPSCFRSLTSGARRYPDSRSVRAQAGVRHHKAPASGPRMRPLRYSGPFSSTSGSGQTPATTSSRLYNIAPIASQSDGLPDPTRAARVGSTSSWQRC